MSPAVLFLTPLALIGAGYLAACAWTFVMDQWHIRQFDAFDTHCDTAIELTAPRQDIEAAVIAALESADLDHEWRRMADGDWETDA